MTAPNRRWLRSSRWLLAAAAFVGVVGGGFYLKHRLDLLHDQSALWEVAGLLNHHMIANDGEWPRSWEDLRAEFDSYHAYKFSFDDLQQRVAIDWEFNPREANLKSRPIWFRSGSPSYWEEAPNRSITEQLRLQPSERHEKKQ